MAIQWGSWAGTSPRRMRVGVDYTSVPAPKSSDTAVTVRATIYVGVQYGVNDQNNSLSWSGTLGSGSGSRPFNLSSNSSRSLHSLSRAVPVSTSPTTVSVTAQLSGVEYVGATARVTATATIPAKPQNPPGQPGAVTMTRISDTSHKISWGASSGSVTRYRLEIYNASTGGWGLLGHTTATAWTTGTTKPNSGYRARVRAEGPGGVSAYTTQATVAYTTPAAPTGVSAGRSGSSIVVSWTDRSPFNDQFKVYASASGGAYTLLATVPNTGTYTHSSPDPTKVWRYQVESVRQASTSGVGVQLTSARATSNEVRLLSPPLAPTLVTPVGSVLDPAKGPVTFVWTHRTADSSKQTAYELQYRVDGGAWVPFSGTTASSRALDLADTGEYEWQVRTKGAHAAFGPWSTVGWFTAADSPVVSITEPVDGAVLTGNRVTARWTPDIQTGAQQLRFVAELQDEAGATLQRAVEEDPVAASRAFSYNLLDNATYQVVVTVTDTNGLVSEPATVTFTTSFLLPAPPTLTASWSDSDASVALVPTASPGETFAWTGAAHASTSTRTVGGKTVTNRATNPSFESDSVPVGGVRSDAWAAGGTWSLYVTGEGYGYGLSPYGENPYGL
ncbi:fibronectin type III domain-containing protein [Atopobiaceae bacterium LCP21S3_F11]